MKNSGHLPIFGVGPAYGAFVIGLTVLFTLLSGTGRLPSGLLTGNSARVFRAAGIIFLLYGAAVWAPAALGKGNIDCYIRKNELCTKGIYALVRNPCYSGIALACTGVLLLAHNLWLLVLPPVFWLSMTVLMKCTEEKWLLERYGDAYRDYCSRVNRCIPRFPKKR